MKKTPILLLLVALLTAVLVACGGGDSDEKRITVASKDFTEQFILGEMYAQLLENNGFTVERQTQPGRHAGGPSSHVGRPD
jgi:osmoprotectant transport system substrate-binding protein